MKNATRILGVILSLIMVFTLAATVAAEDTVLKSEPGVAPENGTNIIAGNRGCVVKTDRKTAGYEMPEKVSMGGTVKIEEYHKDVTDPDIVKAALAVLAEKDEKDEAIEKKNKETRAKAKKKRGDEWDDDDELN